MFEVSNVSSQKRISLQQNKMSNMSNPQVSFTGHQLLLDEKGEKVYRFYLPPIANTGEYELEIVKANKDSEGNIEDEIIETIPKKFEGKHVDVSLKELGIDENSNSVIGFRFVNKNDGKNYLDSAWKEKIDGMEYNIATPANRSILSVSRAMYHIMPGHFDPKLSSKEISQKNGKGLTAVFKPKDITPNHFVKFDAKLQDLTDRISYIKDMGFNRIITTPVFGQDNLSTHGYWSNNLFQMTSSLGELNDYKKFQIELFKNGMGHVADGAFVNEGLEGIHIRDIILNGKDSPYYNWFEIHEAPGSPIFKFGVLPQNDKAYENYEIKIVNSPLIWSVDPVTGKAAEGCGKKNKLYDSKKPTYVQLYDKRLASEKQVKNDELIRSYDIKKLDDPNEIKTWMDSVQPYSFPVKPEAVVEKFRQYNKSGVGQFKEVLKDWENFSITTPENSGGVTLWNGNKDIAKLRFMISETKKDKIRKEIKDPVRAEAKIREIEKSIDQVQDYIVKVGEYWTNKTSKILTEHLVAQLRGAKTVEEFQRKIAAAQANNLIPANLKISNETIKNVLDYNYEAVNKAPKATTIKDGFNEYPLEAMEFSDDVTTLLASPAFKAKAKSKLYDVFQEKTIEILDELDQDRIDSNEQFLNKEKTELNIQNAKVYRLISDDIIRFLMMKGVDPNLSVSDCFTNKGVERLRTVSLGKAGVAQGSHDSMCDSLISNIEHNMDRISMDDIEELSHYLNRKSVGVNADVLRVSELIIDKTESGLEWRIDAAKDTGDSDALVDNESDTKEIWNENIKFWAKYNEGVTKYNPHAYKIGEVTNVSVNDNTKTKRFNSQGDVERKFIVESNFTTQTNYNYFYSTLHSLFGGFPEKGGYGGYSEIGALYQKMLWAWGAVPGFLFSGPKDNVNFSHVGPGNHDKPRTMHGFCVNTALGYNNDFSDATVKELYDGLAVNGSKYSDLIKKIKENNGNKVIKELLIEELKTLIEPKNLAMESAMLESFSWIANQKDENKDLIAPFVKAMEKMTARSNPNAEYFWKRSFDHNYSNIVKSIEKTGNKELASEIETLRPKVHEAFTRPGMIRSIEMAKLMVALPGNPTLYAGDELAETGHEEKSKNTDRQNRGRNQFEKLTDTRYEHVQTYQQKLSKIFNLRKDPALSPLVTGDTIVLNGANIDKNEVVGLYRYNADTDVVVLMSNAGFGQERNAVNPKKVVFDAIDMKAANKNGFAVGLPFKLNEETKYVDALNPNDNYVVKNGSITKEGGKIEVTGTLILKRKDFKETVAFKGNEHPQVKLANLKYNLFQK